MSTSPTEHRNLFRAGGLSAIALAALYLVITVIYSLGGALPEGAEGWLVHLSNHSGEWWAILYLSVLTDLLFFPVARALYQSLKATNQGAALAGAASLALFAVLDLAITWPNYAVLIGLSARYAAGDATILPAAVYAVEVLDSTLFGVYAILVPALGIFTLGLVQLQGGYGRVTAWLGIATGILGTLSVVGPFLVPALGVAAVPTSVLTLVWLFLSGRKLVLLSK